MLPGRQAILLLAAPLLCIAQISGTVHDPSGAQVAPGFGHSRTYRRARWREIQGDLRVDAKRRFRFLPNARPRLCADKEVLLNAENDVLAERQEVHRVKALAAQ
jgi:hypothetical protein